MKSSPTKQNSKGSDKTVNNTKLANNTKFEYRNIHKIKSYKHQNSNHHNRITKIHLNIETKTKKGRVKEPYQR